MVFLMFQVQGRLYDTSIMIPVTLMFSDIPEYPENRFKSKT